MTATPITLTADAGWTDTDQHRTPLHRPFVSADLDPERLVVQYWQDADANLAAKVYFGPHAEGPPGHAHGGSIASVLDEAMGGNCYLHGHAVLAGTLTVRYRAPLPLRTIATVRSRIDRTEGRKVIATGTVHGPDGTLYAEGEGIFVVMRPELQQLIADEARKEGRSFGDAY